MKRRDAQQLHILGARVSAALSALALVAFIATALLGSQATARRDAAQSEAASYYGTHPYLDAPLELMLEAEDADASGIDFAALEDADASAQQAELDALIAAWRAAEAETPAHRFGIAAGRTSALGLLLHALVHAGWLHLLWNLGLLVSAGARLELRLGRAHYAGLLGVSATLGALTQFALAGQGAAPFVGLSAATAGIVGAFAMRPGDTSRDPLAFSEAKSQRSPIRMAAVLGVIALVISALTGASTASFSPIAQLGGFGAGAFAMLGLARLGRLSDESAALVPAVAQAIAHLKGGATPAALELLRTRLSEQADDALAARAFALALRGRGDAREEIERAWSAAVGANQRGAAAALWREASARGEAPRGASALLQTFAKWRRADGAGGEARVALVAALADADAATAARIAREARRNDPVLTLRAAERALSFESLAAADRKVMSDFAEQARKEASNNGVVVLDAAREEQRAISRKPEAPARRAVPIELTPEREQPTTAAPELDAPLGDVGALDLDSGSASEPEVMAERTQPGLAEAHQAFFERGAIDLSPEPAPAEPPGSADAGGAALIDALHAALTEASEGDRVALSFADEPDALTMSGAPSDIAEADDGLAAAEPLGLAQAVPPSPLAAVPRAPTVARNVDRPVSAESPPRPNDFAFGDGVEELFDEEKPEPAPPRLRPLRINAAKPLRLDEGALVLDIEGRGRGKLAFAKIDAVAAVGVKGLTESGKAVLFIDLALGFAKGGEGELRVVRLRADAFDPRTLVADEKSPLTALRKLIAELRARTRAIALPRDAEANAPFRIYADLASYEREVLGGVREG